jgi:hypothetical protein
VARNNSGEPERDEVMIENFVAIFVRGLIKTENSELLSGKTLTDERV